MRYLDFINDDEKMRDFFKLTKDEFLSSYNYLNEKDYDETKKIVDKSVILELTYEGKDNWERPVYKSKTGVRYKDVELGQGINLKSSLYTSVGNSFEGEPLAPLQDNVIPKVLHYIPIKELTGNEDLKAICEKIKFYEDDLLPEDIKRKELIKEIKVEIEWQLDMVSPNVDKETLIQCHKEILQIEQGKVNYQQNEDKITKLSILKDLKQNIEHNIFCYSANYLMTQPKKEYVNEWKAENKKLQIVEEMIKEEKQNVKNKNKDKSL